MPKSTHCRPITAFAYSKTTFSTYYHPITASAYSKTTFLNKSYVIKSKSNGKMTFFNEQAGKLIQMTKTEISQTPINFISFLKHGLRKSNRDSPKNHINAFQNHILNKISLVFLLDKLSCYLLKDSNTDIYTSIDNLSKRQEVTY